MKMRILAGLAFLAAAPLLALAQSPTSERFSLRHPPAPPRPPPIPSSTSPDSTTRPPDATALCGRMAASLSMAKASGSVSWPATSPSAAASPDHETADKLTPPAWPASASIASGSITPTTRPPRTAFGRTARPRRTSSTPTSSTGWITSSAALKRHGIYADINLHISRNYWEGEDFPRRAGQRSRAAGEASALRQRPRQNQRPDDPHAARIRPGPADPHLNPHTKTTYAKEPCVAIVEINNENTLLDLKVSSLPDYYRADIQKKWNAWLKARYGSREKLAAAWGGKEDLGPNLLPARPVTQGGQYFTTTNVSSEARVSLRHGPPT